jgi:predicted transcriptional regulator
MDNLQFLTRKEATCHDLLSCLYNLKQIDIEIFLKVAESPWSTLDQIAESVNRDRSSTHRVLAKLQSAGLIHKQSQGLKKGGYYHVYAPVELAKIKQNAKQRVKEITDSLETLVNNFDDDLETHLKQKLK